MADVDVDPAKYPLTIQAFSACRVEFEGARHETRWRTPASYGIVRREFDHYLLDRARAAGTDVREGAPVTAVSPAADAVPLLRERRLLLAASLPAPPRP